MKTETEAAAKLKVKIDEAKVHCFNGMIALSKMRPEALKLIGHKSESEAIVWTFRHYHKKTVEMTRKFFEEYPD